ncbi:STAS domain-containing protein [Alphaproteobacteria bacterium]|nr:STAS domain-containing protein [Alphaproteobacteria bacterium]
MAFDIKRRNLEAKISLSGDIDLQISANFKTEVLKLKDVKTIIINAALVSYIDSSGIAVLLLIKQFCETSGISLIIEDVSEPVFRVLEISKLDQIFEIQNVKKTRRTPKSATSNKDMINKLLSEK